MFACAFIFGVMLMWLLIGCGYLLTLDVSVNNSGNACDLNKTAKTKSEGGKKRSSAQK